MGQHHVHLAGGQFRPKGCPSYPGEVPMCKTQVARHRRRDFFSE